MSWTWRGGRSALDDIFLDSRSSTWSSMPVSICLGSSLFRDAGQEG